MFNLFCSLIKYLLLFTFKKRRSLILIILSLKKENDILKRLLKVSDKTIKTKKSERFILSVLCSIPGELKKLGIDIHYTIVYRVIQTFRKNGFIKPSGSWEIFLKSHWESLFATDFFTIDSLFGKRLYVFFIIQLKSRRLVQWRITEHPTREFVS